MKQILVLKNLNSDVEVTILDNLVLDVYAEKELLRGSCQYARGVVRTLGMLGETCEFNYASAVDASAVDQQTLDAYISELETQHDRWWEELEDDIKPFFPPVEIPGHIAKIVQDIVMENALATA